MSSYRSRCLWASAAVVAANMLGAAVTDAATRRCDDTTAATHYLVQPVEGMTPAVIADDFVTEVVLLAEDEHIRRFWDEFGPRDDDLEAVVAGWNASRVAKNAVTDRRLFVETLRQLHATIEAFERARQTPEAAGEAIAGEWNDWRGSHMTRAEFIRRFLAEVASRHDRGVPLYGAVLQAAQAMRNRLDDLHGAAGLRDAPDNPFQMWMWDSYIRRQAAADEIARLRSMRDGEAYWNEYLVARRNTIRCVAARRQGTERRQEGDESRSSIQTVASWHRCDELAAHPADPNKAAGVPGVVDDAIDGLAAVEACMAAIGADPDEPRFAFQLGRTLMLGGELELASGFLSDAAAGGSAAALAYLGDLEDNLESARELYEAAADGGFAPAAALLVPPGEGAEGARCDVLAAHPADLMRPHTASGVPDDAIDPMAAFDACVAAVEADPGERRYRFQLGRALLSMEGMDTESAEQFRLASDAGHAAAAAYLAAFVESDDEAEALLQKAANNGFAPARDTLMALQAARQQAWSPPTVFDRAGFRRPHVIEPMAEGNGIPIDDEMMGYLFGFLSIYLPNCPWLGNDGELSSVIGFYQAAEARVTTKIYENPSHPVDNLVPYASASKDGDADSYRFIETYGCEGPVPEDLTAGLVRTVEIADIGGPGSSRFVRSCAEGRLDQEQCQCLADLGRGMIPDIHERHYRRGTIPDLVNRNPLYALQIAVQCGIGEY